MTESEAWLLIAEAWDDVDGWAYAPNPWNDWESAGICESLEAMPDEYDDIRYGMDERLELFGDTGRYLWPCNTAGAKQRTWACLFLAAMT